MGIVSILVLASCAGIPTTASTSSHLASLPTCSDPAVFGAAVGADEAVNRAAFQAAIDEVASSPAGGTVCIGVGRWRLSRAPAGTYDRFAALYVGARPATTTSPALIGRNVTIRGAGPETVLEVVGDQQSTTTILVDILPGADGVTVEQLTLDLTGTTNTSEQTHAVATSGTCAGLACQPIRNVTIRDVTFEHPRNTETRKGDCIRLLGNNEATRVYGVEITGNRFRQCARSAVTIQRGVFDAAIHDNPVIRSSKTCIDGEATGGPTDIDGRIVIANNTFTECATAISLTSTQEAAVYGNAIVGNVTVYRSSRVAITGNTVNHTAGNNMGTIDVANVCDGLTITGNTIARGGVAGPVVKLEPHSGGLCQGVAITGNSLTNNTPAWVVYMESISNVLIAANRMAITVPAPAMSAIYERSVLASSPVVGLAITGNQISGPMSYVVRLHASPGTFGAGVAITGNVASGPAFGMCLSDAPGFTAPITVNGNSMGLGVYGQVAINAGS